MPPRLRSTGASFRHGEPPKRGSGGFVCPTRWVIRYEDPGEVCLVSVGYRSGEARDERSDRKRPRSRKEAVASPS